MAPLRLLRLDLYAVIIAVLLHSGQDDLSTVIRLKTERRGCVLQCRCRAVQSRIGVYQYVCSRPWASRVAYSRS